MPRAADAAGRLERFYAPQAGLYDSFRQRLLHGRAEIIAGLHLPGGATVVELGAGTGSNLELFGERLASFASVQLVDLCPSLLAQARQRARRYPNVQVIAADACEYRPPAPVDCVIFSYSLTMIPDWRQALRNGIGMLRPGGKLVVVDFTLPVIRAAHRCFASRARRALWRTWFAHDGVYLNDEHVSVLERLLPHHAVRVDSAPIPYLPGLRVPYYRFVGSKTGAVT